MAERQSNNANEEPLVIRPLEVEDFAQAAPLLAELGRPALAAGTEAYTRGVFERHLAGHTASLIALRGNRAIGLLSLHIRERLSQIAPEAWIPDFIVTAEEQGRGAALALMNRAIEIARERGCYRIVLESHYHRQRAYRFYAREGFADVGKCFSLSLAPPSKPA